jgi:hypothetical protein
LEADFLKAADDLSKGEQLVNAVQYSFKGIPLPLRASSIQIMVNLGILYYRVGFLEESFSCL